MEQVAIAWELPEAPREISEKHLIVPTIAGSIVCGPGDFISSCSLSRRLG